MEKKVKVIMIPTGEKAIMGGIEYFSNTKSIQLRTHESTIGEGKQIYFVSDEGIKEGDWGIITVNTPEGKLHTSLYKCKDPTKEIGGGKKVIATRDKSLKINIVKDLDTGEETEGIALPQIPEAFIQDFVESNGEIKQVEIEMNQPVCQCDTTEKELNCMFKSGIHDCTKPYDGNDFYGHNIKTTENNEVIILNK